MSAISLSPFPIISKPTFPFSHSIYRFPPISTSSFKFPSFSTLSNSVTRITSNRVQASSGNAPLSATLTTVTVDSFSDSSATAFVIRARNQIGLLQVITRLFKILGLCIDRATVEFEGDFFTKTFFVTDSDGNKIEDQENLKTIKKALVEAVDGRGHGVVRRPGLVVGLGDHKAKVEGMFGLMDGFLKNDPFTLQKDILDHVEYTVARSRFSFDDFEAYQALSHSVRDHLIERWHDTQVHFKKKGPKRLYFLSLEFLMGSYINLRFM